MNKQGISFAVLLTDIAWRADLSIRYCEYFAHRFNADDFSNKIFFPQNIDDALQKCETEYLMIVNSGFIPFSEDFVDELLFKKDNMFIGHVVLDYDFAYIDNRFLFVNMQLWRECGSPKYVSSNRQGVLLSTDESWGDRKVPKSLTKIETADNIYVPAECSTQGADFIIGQLNKFGKLETLTSIDGKFFHFINNRTPYLEIHTQTQFEKLYVEKNRIHAIGDTDFARFIKRPLDILVTPADGIRSLILAQELNVKKVVIFSKSSVALELQKQLFNQKNPVLFGEVIKQFKQDFSSVTLPSDFYKHENQLIIPFTGEAEFVIADCTSFEMEELIKGVDHTKSAMFDFSNIFVLPHNYYRRPLYQIEALFAEIYSLIKSRTGPSYIAGLGPRFIDLYKLDVNTSNAQFELDINSALEMEELPEVFFKPDLTALKIQDEEIKPMWYSSVFKKIENLVVAPKVEPVKPSHVNECIAKALQDGFSILSEENSIVLVVKEQQIEGREMLYFYGINEKTHEWKFFVGQKGTEKRIEFSNGISSESCLKHINIPIKINIKTALKYFI